MLGSSTNMHAPDHHGTRGKDEGTILLCGEEKAGDDCMLYGE